MASVNNSDDEIQTFADMRIIGPSEVFWRYGDYGLHHRYPTCTSLTIHLENEQTVYFEEDDDLVAMLNDPQKATQLQAFYNLNRDNPTEENVTLKYVDFPEKYVWHQRSKTWEKRKEVTSIKKEAIGTLPLLQPNMGDIFYLKLLLTHNHCKGKKSETDLRTVGGTTFDTCKETCMALGILGDDTEWYKCLDEVEVASRPNSFQNTFANNYNGESPK